jgi:hypothetical protein
MPKRKVKEKQKEWCEVEPRECDGSCCYAKKRKGGKRPLS